MLWLEEILLLFPGFASLCWAITLLCGWRRNTRLQKITSIVLLLVAFCSFWAVDLFKGSRQPDSYEPDIIKTFFLTFPVTVILYYGGYRISNLSKSDSADERVADLTDSDNLIEDREPDDFSEHWDDPDETIDYQYKSYEKLLPEFNHLMDEKKIFRQKNLCREDVANLLKTNRTYISKLLHDEYQCSFSDYINRKRIEYALELIRKMPELTQDRLAEKCGFTHSSSFSRSFKQYMGMTFREWHKQYFL